MTIPQTCTLLLLLAAAGVLLGQSFVLMRRSRHTVIEQATLIRTVWAVTALTVLVIAATLLSAPDAFGLPAWVTGAVFTTDVVVVPASMVLPGVLLVVAGVELGAVLAAARPPLART
jgi:hypothetical protein